MSNENDGSDPLMNISTVDGRYCKATRVLCPYFSEFGYIKHRAEVEIEWLIFLKLPNKPAISSEEEERLRQLYKFFTVTNAQVVKDKEKKLNHDVKAVEVFLRDKITSKSMTSNIKHLSEYIHWGLTSDDVNNVAQALMHERAILNVILPALFKVESRLAELTKKHKGDVMMARTHGQPASPTTFGKELAVYLDRFMSLHDRLLKTDYKAKFNGAVGNYNAMRIAYPDRCWRSTCKDFIRKSMHLEFQQLSTQIDSHDWLATLYNNLSLLCAIGIDMSNDIWLYISSGHIKLSVSQDEVGSSTMPHKVNPIHFENAEANFGIAQALLAHFARKLPISRLQRDLSDSSTIRCVGNALAHLLIAINSIYTGLKRITYDDKKGIKELEGRDELLGEALQTIMRMHQVEGSYDIVKKLTRGQDDDIGKAVAKQIDRLKSQLPEEEIQKLQELVPSEYIGYAEELAEYAVQEWGKFSRNIA